MNNREIGVVIDCPNLSKDLVKLTQKVYYNYGVLPDLGSH